MGEPHFLRFLMYHTIIIANLVEDVAAPIAKEFKIIWPFFIAQLISFGVVLFILKKFAFGPIQQMLEERRQRIAAGEANLKKIETQLAESEKRTADALEKANADAQRLIDEARDNAAKIGESETQKAVAAAQNIITKAEEAAKAEREQMKAELKAEFGKLLTTATTQVTGRTLNDDDQRRINEEALNTLPN
ncbi:MAG: ATP synthase F0 subunit B [Verrucomicrobiota bacterium JB023]|nr:ATP synthase F0 subunit B [Verrucomicrobiota bacterium JB023]